MTARDSVCDAGWARTIHSPWIGDVACDPECILDFPFGLPGFEDHRRIIPVEIPAQRPLIYLQSVESPGVCFVTLPVYVIDPGYRIRITDDERMALLIDSGFMPVIGADVLCLALLMPCAQTVESNMDAAVIVNLHNRRGIQCIPPPGRSSRFRLSADSGWTAVC